MKEGPGGGVAWPFLVVLVDLDVVEVCGGVLVVSQQFSILVVLLLNASISEDEGCRRLSSFLSVVCPTCVQANSVLTIQARGGFAAKFYRWPLQRDCWILMDLAVTAMFGPVGNNYDEPSLVDEEDEV